MAGKICITQKSNSQPLPSRTQMLMEVPQLYYGGLLFSILHANIISFYFLPRLTEDVVSPSTAISVPARHAAPLFPQVCTTRPKLVMVGGGGDLGWGTGMTLAKG